MNKIYNIVWNESSGMWVVTSELTRKGGQRHRKIKENNVSRANCGTYVAGHTGYGTNV